MHFDEKQIGDFRIYTTAELDVKGGFVAGVVVKRFRTGQPAETVFFNRRMLAGFGFPMAEEALAAGMELGTQAVQRQLAVA